MENSENSVSILYKLLMKKMMVDTRGTTYKYHSSPDNVENYIGIVNSIIELLNLHVKNEKEGLTARGE